MILRFISLIHAIGWGEKYTQTTSNNQFDWIFASDGEKRVQYQTNDKFVDLWPVNNTKMRFSKNLLMNMDPRTISRLDFSIYDGIYQKNQDKLVSSTDESFNGNSTICLTIEPITPINPQFSVKTMIYVDALSS